MIPSGNRHRRANKRATMRGLAAGSSMTIAGRVTSEGGRGWREGKPHYTSEHVGLSTPGAEVAARNGMPLPDRAGAMYTIRQGGGVTLGADERCGSRTAAGT